MVFIGWGYFKHWRSPNLVRIFFLWDSFVTTVYAFFREDILMFLSYIYQQKKWILCYDNARIWWRIYNKLKPITKFYWKAVLFPKTDFSTHHFCFIKSIWWNYFTILNTIYCVWFWYQPLLLILHNCSLISK